MRPSCSRALPCAVATALLAACGSTAHSHVPAEGDGATLQKVLDGALAPAAGLLAVAWSSGWPIQTSQGFLFAVVDGGQGPYRLTSPSGSFPDVTLTSESGVAWALAPIAAPAGASYQYANHYGDPVADAYGRHYRFDGSDELALVRPAGPHVERWPGVGDANIPARTLRVWVPAQAPTHFLYGHDGQNLFTSRAAYGGWHLQDAAGPATLVIGIDNSPARFDEYTQSADHIDGRDQGGKGGLYSDYVEKTVRPFIESRYGAPRKVGLIGSSLGGLIVYEQVLRYPASYDFAASLSGTMGWGSIDPGTHNPTMIELYAKLSACPPPAFYLDSGGGPGSGCVDSDHDGIRDDTIDSADNYCENQQLLEVLHALGCARVTWKWSDGAPHNEAAWSGRAPAILALFESL